MRNWVLFITMYVKTWFDALFCSIDSSFSSVLSSMGSYSVRGCYQVLHMFVNIVSNILTSLSHLQVSVKISENVGPSQDHAKSGDDTWMQSC
jgi:hypothetical protein